MPMVSCPGGFDLVQVFSYAVTDWSLPLNRSMDLCLPALSEELIANTLGDLRRKILIGRGRKVSAGYGIRGRGGARAALAFRTPKQLISLTKVDFLQCFRHLIVPR